MAWQYLTEDQKQQHPLYNKFTAFKFFMILLYISFFISLGSLSSDIFQLKQNFLEISGSYSLNAELEKLVSLTSMLGYGGLLASFIFVLAISKAGKSKTAFKLFVTFLILNPLMQVILAIILQSAFSAQGFPIEFVSKSIVYIFLYIIIGVIFAVYCYFSKAYNLQFFSRVKA